MAEYYLISQLPSLDGISENTPLPITEERFAELCNRFLGKRAQEMLSKLTLSPPKNSEDSGSALIDAWNESERTSVYAWQSSGRKNEEAIRYREQSFSCGIYQGSKYGNRNRKSNGSRKISKQLPFGNIGNAKTHG